MTIPPRGIVILSWEEVLLGASVGVRRHVKAQVRRRTAVYGEPVLPCWHVDVEAALAELAFAKGTGLYWPASTDPDNHIGDVGGYHVRSTSHETGGLLLHERDDETAIFVLLVGQREHWRIVGWCEGREGKAHWDVSLPRPAFRVPQDVLHAFEEEALC